MVNGKTKVKDLEQNKTATTEVKNERNQNDSFKFTPETSTSPVPDKLNDSFEDISWSASEFIAHEKNLIWYVLLTVATLIIAMVVYILTKDKISTVVVVVAGVMFGVYAARKPRLMNYKLDSSGLTVQAKLFSYDSFKSFAIDENSPIPNIILIPLKRFMPSLSVYLDPSSKEDVINVLSTRLPQDFHEQDFIERFMLRIRF